VSADVERVPLKHLPRECAILTDVLRERTAPVSVADLTAVIERDYPEIDLANPHQETVRVRLSLLFLSGWISREKCHESGAEVYALLPVPKAAEVAP
jgi:hypothetical protein